jgi:branched-chain amino acid transport system substrate-binding protein
LKKTVFILTALLIAVVIVMAGCPSPTPTTTAPTTTAPTTTAPTTTAPTTAPERTLRIGALMALTGWFTVMDIPDWTQTVIACDLLNEQGGINVNGQIYKVELVAEDTKSDFGGVAAAANKLIYDKGVKFIIGPTAFFAPAASPVTEPAGVMKISTWCTNMPGENDASAPFSFTTSHGSVPTGMATIKYLKQNYPEVKNVALVTPDDGAIPYLIPIIRDLMAAEGINVVGDTIGFPNEMQDFSPIVAKIQALQGIDAIFQENGVAPHVGAIIKGLREAGNTKPYFAAMPVTVGEVVNIAGAAAAEGLVTVTLSSGDPGNSPLLQEMIDLTIAEYGADTPLHHKGSNVLYIFKEAMEAAGSIDPAAVKAALESMGTVDTLFGTGVLCGQQTYGINHVIAHPLPIQTFKNGQAASGGWVDIGVIP